MWLLPWPLRAEDRIPLPAGRHYVPWYHDAAETARLAELLTGLLADIDRHMVLPCSAARMLAERPGDHAFAGTLLVVVVDDPEIDLDALDQTLRRLGAGQALAKLPRPRDRGYAWQERHVKPGLLALLHEHLGQPEHPLSALRIDALPVDRAASMTTDVLEWLDLLEAAAEHRMAHAGEGLTEDDYEASLMQVAGERLAARLLRLRLDQVENALALLSGKSIRSGRDDRFRSGAAALEQVGLARFTEGALSVGPLGRRLEDPRFAAAFWQHMPIALRAHESAPEPGGGHERSPEGASAERGAGSFAARVEAAARLHERSARIERLPAPLPFEAILRIVPADLGAVAATPVAVLAGDLTAEALRTFLDEIDAPYRMMNPALLSRLVCAGRAPPALLGAASARRVAVHTFTEYQEILDFSGVLAEQTRRLENDPVYPPAVYVEPRATIHTGIEETVEENALEALMRFLSSEEGQFVLVLGDFGAGKTFLLHELARRTAKAGLLTPLLIEMRALEKARSLDVLVVQHLARMGMPRIDLPAFRYMLREGRILLLFDGFDELALRVTYERAAEHFETLVQAAEGRAKVVATSRTQHFETDRQVRTVLGQRAAQARGSRLVKLLPFSDAQIRAYLTNRLYDPRAAEARHRLLEEVKDLLGLSQNPRLLSFIVELDPEKLAAARDHRGEITAAALYQVLLDRWLGEEFDRVHPPGALPGLTLAQRWEAVTGLAIHMWPLSERAVRMAEIPPELLSAVMELSGASMSRAEAAHQVGSGTLLVRDEEGQFSFLHQSILEWLVARAAAEQAHGGGDCRLLSARPMSALMADFFVDLAGRATAASWAHGVLNAGAQDVAAVNALLVLGRVGDAAAGGVSLRGRDLRGQDLSNRDLRGVDFSGADLRETLFVGADLTGVNLTGARLGRADLKNANLTNADLRGADLSFARLTGADLRGAAGLTAAQVRGAKLVGARGVEVEGLVEAGAAPPVLPEEIAPMIAPMSPCYAVAWSPLGDLLASGHHDGSVRLWDAVTGRAIRVLDGHTGPVWGVAFSPDGRTLASGSDDTTVRLRDVATARPLRTFEGHTGLVLGVAFSPDGRTLASGSSDRTVRLWDVAAARFLCVFEGHTNWIRSVAFSPDGHTLASGSDDRTVRLWNVAAARLLRTFVGHTRLVRTVAFSPDGNTLASGSEDWTVRLWDVATARFLRAFEGHEDAIWGVAFNPDGNTLASGSANGTVRLWDVAAARSVHGFMGHVRLTRSVAFSPDGDTLASCSDDGTVKLWDVPTARFLRAFDGTANPRTSVAFSPDGTTLVSGAVDATICLWKVAAAGFLRAFEGHAAWVTSVAFSPDGHTLASGSSDYTVKLWNVAAARFLRDFVGHASWVTSVAFSPDGNTLASGSNDKTVRLWDVATARSLRTFAGHTDLVKSIAFSPDGHALASGSNDQTVKLWDAAGARLLHTFEGNTSWVTSVAFSPDGGCLASGSSDKTVRFWDVSTARSRACEGHTDGVTSVAFSPDGHFLASGSDDHTVRLWDVSTARSLRTFAGHHAPVTGVAFSPDGTTLASASEDGTLRLWDVATARCLAVLLGLRQGWVAFTPGGRYKLGGDAGGSFWHVAGLCRFEPGELDEFVPGLRLKDDEPLLSP